MGCGDVPYPGQKHTPATLCPCEGRIHYRRRGLLAMQHPVTAGLTEVLTPFVLEAAVTPEIHLAPEGLSFPCVQKSLSSLTLQHTSAMQRDNQRSLHPFTTQFCTGQAQLLQQYLILLLAKSKIPRSKAF